MKQAGANQAMATPRTKKSTTASTTATKAAPKAKAAKAVPGPKLVVAPEVPVVAPPPPAPAMVPAPVTGQETSAVASTDAPTMRKKELIDRIVTATSAKRRDVKLIVEAALNILGEALSNGEELNLPPFGKAKVNRQRDLGNGEMMMVKVRRTNGPSNAADDSKEPLADDEE
jgi:nucleoid DNA-binding protein